MTPTPLQLLQKIRQEDSEQAFRCLFDLQYDRLFRIAFFYLQRDDWAEEVALDVLADLWNNRHSMIIPDNFEHYSMAMVHNAALNLWRREQRFTHESEDSVDASCMGLASVESQAENEELFLVYERALASLPLRCRAVWQMVKEEGRSYAEVAASLDISTKTVDAQMQKAVKILRQEVGEYLHTL